MNKDVPIETAEKLEPIISVEHIHRLSQHQRSLCVSYNGGRWLLIPAAVALRWQGSYLIDLIASDRIRIYPKRKATKRGSK